MVAVTDHSRIFRDYPVWEEEAKLGDVRLINSCSPPRTELMRILHWELLGVAEAKNPA